MAFRLTITSTCICSSSFFYPDFLSLLYFRASIAVVPVIFQLTEPKRDPIAIDANALEVAGIHPSLFRRIPSAFLSHLPGCIAAERSEEHTSELQSLMRISYAVFCLKKKN